MIKKLNYDPELVSIARNELFLEFGTTLRGLQSVHQINPQEYLSYVHDIPLSEFLKPNLKLKTVLKTYPQKKVVFTNSDRWHTDRILSTMGIREEFQQIVDILDVTPYCKPMREAFEIALEIFEIKDPATCLMVDDNIRNINTAKTIGMQTLWIAKENQKDFSLETPQIQILEDMISIFPVEELI
jgi:pyrimidine 5'-nucleotidase